MREREKLFVIRDSNNKIIAITEERQLAVNYIKQFYDYFESNGSSIEKITEIHIIRNLLNEYVDIATLQEYSENLVLTDYEYKFYNIHFKKIYSDFKSTISNLLIFKNYINLNEEGLELISDTFKMMYDKCYSFDQFITNINPEYLFKYIITDPIMSKESTDELNQLMIKMNYNIDKGDTNDL